MSIKLALLKSGETIVSDVKELVSDDKVCGYLFTKPQVIEVRRSFMLLEEPEQPKSGDLEVSLTSWIVLAKDEKIPVSPDWIVTILDPIETIEKMYEEKVNGKSSEVSFTES